MANGTQLAVWLDLQNNPLGRGGKDPNMNVAANYVIPSARVYVVNHSRTRAFKRVVVPVSDKRGAEEALIYDKELAKIYNVDTLYRAAEKRDMSRVKSEIYPCVATIKVGGRVYAIPPARTADSEPPRVYIDKDGVWDLYLGNYERMRGFDPFTNRASAENPDPTIIGEEKTKLALRWNQRHNPVFRYTDDGETTDIKNEYGFLEFIRETQKAMTEPIDKEYLAALDIAEV